MAFEYKIISIAPGGWLRGGRMDIDKAENTLNELGAEGWELVSAFDSNEQSGASRMFIYTFKRTC